MLVFQAGAAEQLRAWEALQAGGDGRTGCWSTWGGYPHEALGPKHAPTDRGNKGSYSKLTCQMGTPQASWE